MAKKLKRKSASAARRIRRGILSRWLQLLDMTESLERDVEKLPDGVLSDDERWIASTALESVWHLLTCDRPLYPEGPDGPVVGPTRIHLLTQRVLRIACSLKGDQ